MMEMDITQRRQKFLKSFKASRKKYFVSGLGLILIFLTLVYLGPFDGIGLLGKKKSEEQPSLAQTSTPSIDISAEARQTYYQLGVPHTNKDGRLTTTYNPNLSFFPNGVFWVSSDSNDANAVSALKNAGFNTAMTARQAGYADTNPAVLLNQIGTDDSFKLIINQDLLTNPPTYKSDPTSFNESRFQTYKNDSRVLGWWMDDEPLNVAVVSKTDPQFNYDANNQVYQTHKDQTSQVFFITDSGGQITNPRFNDFMNLGSVASDYIYPKSVWETFKSFKLTADSVKAMVQAVGEKKPAWFVPQAFDGTGAIYPTPQEERAQVYTSVIHGATGILHFTWDSCIFRRWGAASGQTTDFSGIRPNIPQALSNCPNSTVIDSSRQASARALWDSLDASKNGINSELATLKPVILSPTSGENYSVFVDRAPISSAPIRTMLKSYNGEDYLLAVNIDNATINAKFQFSFPSLNSTVLFESNRQPTVQGNSITDSFSPFAVHVYKFSSKPPVVSIVTPVTGSRLMGKVNIKAEVSNLTPSKVEIKVDNVLKTTLTNAPYSYTWDTTSYPDALHQIEVIAYDSSGKSFSSAIGSFQTINNCPDFSNDGRVNSLDVGLFNRAVANSYSGTYNALYDLNGDGRLNSQDSGIFNQFLKSKGFPYTCSSPTPTPTPILTPTPTPTQTPTPTPVPQKITASVSGTTVTFRWPAQPNAGIIAVWPSASSNACVNVNADVVKNSGTLSANTSTYTWNGAPNGSYKAAFVQYVAGNTMPVGCTSFAVGNIQGISTTESQDFASMVLRVFPNFFGRVF